VAEELLEEDALPEAGNDDTEALIQFLERRNDILNEVANNTIFHIMPDNCSSSTDCPYICQKYITSTGVDLNEVLDVNILDSNELLLPTGDDLGLDDLTRRRSMSVKE